MFSLDKTNAFLVGAASGIGRALALEFSRRGASVVLADIDEAGVADTASKIIEAGGKALGVCCDVTDAQSVSDAIAAAETFLGQIDISVNAVGVLLSGSPEDIPVTEWQRIFDVNVLGAVRLIDALLPKMIARGSGYIVNTASVAGLYPFAMTRVPYAASKAALISMSQNLAIYLKPKGINVSCLCPGPTATPIGVKSTTWTEGMPMVGPGKDYVLLTPQESARRFCDGIEAKDVIVLAQEGVTLDHMRRWAISPANFAYEKIGQYACEDYGLPHIDFTDQEIIDAIQGVDPSFVSSINDSKEKK